VRYILILALGLTILVSCHPGTYKTEIEFGNKLAQQGLWKEAHFRWQKTITRGKESAAAYNNLAVYYEKNGEKEKAEAAYQKALKLAPGNQYIISNYDKFKQKNKGTQNEK
jgi:Flp pilus assembly protein TadD